MALLDEAIRAVDPETLMANSLKTTAPETNQVIGLGKASAAMCRGAERVLGPIHGICIATGQAAVPEGVELVVGDHPIPGAASFEAGRRALQEAAAASKDCLALVSGGGSALCEWPREGVGRQYLRRVNQRLLMSGTSIEETNLVRGHLSALKCGGLARIAAGPFHTYVLSDVAGAGPGVVASGPTISTGFDPEAARRVMRRIGLEVPEEVWAVMQTRVPDSPHPERVTVIGDGRTAAEAMRDAARSLGITARVAPGWLTGDLEAAVAGFFDVSTQGIIVAAGETSVVVPEPGRGGRNTHAALLAAHRIAGTRAVFAAFATDGVDGNALAAGAIVDGTTVSRGGDASRELSTHDSASYLDRTGDLVVTGPTDTNVGDLWVLWRP